jgi:arylsulfatase A-like enzyme
MSGPLRPRRGDAARLHRSLAAALACLGLILCTGAGCRRDPGDRPGLAPRHVLLITTSSLRADHLSCYLYPRPTSAWPADEDEKQEERALALDDLAAQGVLFANAFSPANRTVPALEVLFTGSAGVEPAQDQPLAGEARALAEVFREAGFCTAAFVSGAPLREKLGLDQGFELFTWRFGDTPVLSLATEWLATRDADDARPLFLWIHLSGCDPPHDPRALPPRHGSQPQPFDFARYFEDPGYAGSADGSLSYLEQAQRGEVQPTPADLGHLSDLYDGEVARVASGIRGLALFLRNLDEGRAWRETLVVFAGLHGLELGEHGRGFQSATSRSDAVLRIPLFLRHPPSLTGARILAEPVSLEDVAPTVCEWFHLAPPSPASPAPRVGRSLLPLVDSFVKRPFASRSAVALFDAPIPFASLRAREWSLWWRGPAEGAQVGQLQLFDRRRDPGELRDVGAEHAALVRELSGELERAMQAAGWPR